MSADDRERQEESELVVLQTIRLKGRVRRDDLGADVDELVASGLVVDGPMLRLSAAGRTRLTELLHAERSSADAAAVTDAYGEFRSVNADFKALVTDWQLKDGEPNTHEDAAYDAAVLARLDEVHQRVTPILGAVVAQLPRLGGYSEKLRAALDRVHAGETMWLSRPLIDSYHTVWFELHEELILAAGLTRGAEDG
ncbi:MarR family transcriptional regulator [Mycobacterium sp.]|uniref:MarR family transcriptional regulator n=1 Tax=Mycobacterium sp. TaxID=1785 RepID=UPI0025D4A4AA|nr:MarR family transcriptional regulator [Mycobacterium sp.]